MLLPGAEALGMTHSQCLELIERTEDTLHFLTSSLTFLIDAESKKAQPDLVLLAEWEALDQEVFDLTYSLPGTDVNAYQRVVEVYSLRNRELRPVVDRYIGTRGRQ